MQHNNVVVDALQRMGDTCNDALLRVGDTYYKALLRMEDTCMNARYSFSLFERDTFAPSVENPLNRSHSNGIHGFPKLFVEYHPVMFKCQEMP